MNHPLLILTAAALIVAAAGYVRGYGGFGFSMITVATLSLFMPVDRVVPMVLMLEVIASLVLLPGAWQSVSWSVLAWMLAGVAIGTPLGVRLLRTLHPAPMQGLVAAAIFVLAVLLLKDVAVRRGPNRTRTVLAGMISGVLNGAAAIGGPPAILLFFSSTAGAAVSRASLIAFFLMTDTLAAGVCAASGIIDTTLVGSALMLSIPMVIGLFAGQRSFKRTSERVFRRRVLLCLMALSLLTLVQAMGQMVAL
jgi:hypothetical protein